jgi:hypothetical protein
MTTDIYRDTRKPHDVKQLTGYTLDNGGAVFVPVGLRAGDHVTVHPPRAPWWRFWDRPRPFAGRVVASHMRGAALELQQAFDVICDQLMTRDLRVVGVTVGADHITFGLSPAAYAQLKYMLGVDLQPVEGGEGEFFTWRDKITFYVADELERAEVAGHA